MIRSELKVLLLYRLQRETVESPDASLAAALFAVSEENMESTVSSFQTSGRHDLALKALIVGN